MIKDLETTDLNKLVECIELYQQTVGIENLDKEYLIKQIKDSLIHQNNKIIVKEMMGKVVGFAIGTLLQNHWNGKRYGEVSYIFAHQELMARTVKKELFDNLNQWFSEEGCHYSLSLTTHWNDEYEPEEEFLNTTKEFYTQVGCKIVGYNFVKELNA